MTQERRVHPRVEKSASVAVSVLASPDADAAVGLVVFCASKDISAGGLRLRLHKPVPVGASLKLLVTFSDPARAFELVGRVSWARNTGGDRPYAIGVRLTHSRPEMQAAWEQSVSAEQEAGG